jgi:hypothetical protein
MIIVSPIMTHFLIRKKKQQPANEAPTTIEQRTEVVAPPATPAYRSTIHPSMLDDQEILLMKFIMNQSVNSALTSIEQINQ